MRIQQIMRHDLSKVGPGDTFERILSLYADPHNKSRLTYVVDDRHLLLGIVGMPDLLAQALPLPFIDSYRRQELTESRALLTALQSRLEELRNLPAERIMRTQFSVIGPNDSFMEAAELILNRSCVALPVVNSGGVLKGEVTRRLLLRALDRVLHDRDFVRLAAEDQRLLDGASEFFLG